MAYLCGNIGNHLGKDSIQPRSSLGNQMIHTIESSGIPEDLPHIKRDIGNTVVFPFGLIPFAHFALIFRWSPRITDDQLSFDGTEIHGVLDDFGVMGNTKENRVDGFQE